MRRPVTVTVADSHVGAIDDVAARLRDAGLQVDEVLATLGMITGSVADAQLATVLAVEGVAAIEPQTEFQLAPPDADVQ